MAVFALDEQVMTRMLITPEVAKGFLGSLYEKQRKRRNAYVQAYAADMREGNWNPNNPAPIVISKEGKCIDGQHRLLAIVETGIPCSMWVCHGVSNDVYDFIDSGHTRLLSDRDIDIPMKNKCCALARRTVAIDKGVPLSTAVKGGGNVTQQQIMERLAAQRDRILFCVRRAERVSSVIGKGSNTFYALPLYMSDAIYGVGTSENIKEKVKEPSASTMALQRHILKMYSGSIKPHGIDVVPVFICFCDAVLNDRTYRSYAKKDDCMKSWEQAYRSVIDDAR